MAPIVEDFGMNCRNAQWIQKRSYGFAMLRTSAAGVTNRNIECTISMTQQQRAAALQAKSFAFFTHQLTSAR